LDDGGATDDGDLILNATIDSDGGAVYLDCEDDLTINGSLLTQGEYAELRAFGSILVTAAGRIDAEVSTGANGPLFEVTAGQSIAMADGSVINARDGEIQILADGDISVSSLVGNWYVSVFSRDGSILDGGDSDPDIVSETAQLTAYRVAAVGTAADPLDTQLDELSGESVTGFYVDNTGPLDIAYDGIVAGGDVRVTASGALSVSASVSGGGAVTLRAPNSTLTVDAPVTTTPGTGGELILLGRVVLNAAVTPGAGTITLQASNLVVSSLTPTATGFHISFSQDLDASVLNLYDQDGALGPADVTLTGDGTGKIRGSLVIGPGLREATFIKTGGLLQPDQYTVTLTSATTAFRDSGGWLLDGDENGTPGGDFVDAFQVPVPAATAVIVSLPDVTRGYGQPVNLPANNPTAGLPLTIHNGQDVGRVELELRFGSRLLNISAFTLADSVASRGALLEVATLTPGVAVLTITAPAGLAADANPLIVGSFTARVPDDAPYGGKHVLDITALRAYDTATDPAELPALDDDGIHVAAFFGDTSGDGAYNSPDATLVRRVIGQVNTGFSAYQLADPVLIADITLNGRVQSNDTTNIRRAIGLVAVPNIPPLPTGLTPPAASGADPRIFIPRDLVGALGETVTVPVMIEVSESVGLTIGGFDVVLEFDPARFTVSQAKLGNLLLGTDVLGTMTQPAPGQLIYTADSLIGTSRFPAGTVGDLLTLTVAVGAGAAPGPAAWNLLANLGPSRTGVYDAALAELVLHPPLTNASGDAGDGLLLVDDGRSAWHNPLDGLDVNGDGLVTPLDAVIVINRLNAKAVGDAPASLAYYDDVNGDSFCTAQDVLIVINYLNAQSLPAAEGEPSDLRDRVFHDLETELSPLESVLGDLADDVASVWR
jgi:hypothetical protein